MLEEAAMADARRAAAAAAAAAAEKMSPDELAAWVVAQLRAPDDDAACVPQRSVAAALWSGVDAPQNPEVVAAASAALARAAAAGRTDGDALLLLCELGSSCEDTDDGGSECAAALVAQPGGVAALLALMTTDGGGAAAEAAHNAQQQEGARSLAVGAADDASSASLALFVACWSPDGAAELLRAGVVEACWTSVDGESLDRCESALLLLKAVVNACSTYAWPYLSAAGATARVLRAPCLLERASCGQLAPEVMTFLHAAARDAAKRATNFGVCCGFLGMPPTIFEERLEFSVRTTPTSAGFWAAVARELSLAPSDALTALAEHDAQYRAAHGVAVSALLDALGGCEDMPAAMASLAHAALFGDAWPLAPLLLAPRAAAALDAASRPRHTPARPGAVAARALLQACSNDTAVALLASVQPGPRALAAHVSCALLAPRIPHLGALLHARAGAAAPPMADALLQAAALLAPDAHHASDDGTPSGDDHYKAHFRFTTLCGAMGALAVEAAAGAPCDATGGGMLVREDDGEHRRVHLRFEWRRRRAASAARGFSCGAKRSRDAKSDGDGSGSASSGDDEADADGGGAPRRRAHALLTRADVGAQLHGSVAFVVGGRIVHALGLAMQRASPVLAEAMHAGGVGGGSSADAPPIPLPPLRDLSDEAHHALFLRAVEHAYTGRVRGLDAGSMAPLWRLAHALAMDDLKAWAARRLAPHLAARPAELFAAFELSQSHCCGALEAQCARAMLTHLGALAAAAARAAADCITTRGDEAAITAARAAHHAARAALHHAAAALAALAATRRDALQRSLAAAFADVLRELFGMPAHKPAQRHGS
jgi:hypothetical protein